MMFEKLVGRVRRRWKARDYMHRGHVLVASVGAAVLVTACGGTGGVDGRSESPGGNGNTSLTVGFAQEPPSWNYLQNASTAIRSLLMLNVLEPLLEEKEDGSFVPLLAESFEVSDDGLEYTFHIREATFHDGSDLSADDVVYSLSLSQESTLADLAGPYESVKTIEKVDEQTVRVVLSEPSQSFLEAMATDSALIVPEGSEGSLDRQPVGTGSFVFAEWRNGVEVSLDRHNDYWGEPPQFAQVTWRFITDPNAAINALLAGDVDLISPVNALDRVESAERQGYIAHETAGNEIHYVSLNAADEVFDDPRIRQAIAHAIDRDAYVAAIPVPLEPICVLVNPATESWNSDYCPYPYDPDQARQLLAEAGAEGLELRFPHLAGTAAPELFRQQLADVGITLKTEPLDLATFLEQVLERADYQFTTISGPQQIDSWKCPGWYLQDCFEEFDSLLNEANTSLDREEWTEKRREAVEIHAERAYLIPLANQDQITLHRDNLEGLKAHSSSSEFDLRGLRWTED